MSDLRYPIGKFAKPPEVTEEMRRRFITEMAETPAKLRAAAHGLAPSQLDTPYRPGGWSVRQVVHHLPDSHMNSYIRFKLALTEQEPTVKTYHENLWAELEDARNTPVEISLNLLDSLHQRWIVMLRSLTSADWARTFRHPEQGILTLDSYLALYAWHGRHHVAHITSLRERMGWN